VVDHAQSEHGVVQPVPVHGQQSGGTEMVNHAYGIASVEATGLCPRNFSTTEELKLIQATLVKVSSGDGKSDNGSGGAVMCMILASEGQPSCRLHFEREAPNPFVNHSSLDKKKFRRGTPVRASRKSWFWIFGKSLAELQLLLVWYCCSGCLLTYSMKLQTDPLQEDLR